MDTKKKIVKKRKFNLFRTVFFLFSLYLIYLLIMYIINLPIRNILIIGNSYVSDKEIIDKLELKEYPSIIKFNSDKAKKLLLEDSLIEDVVIMKKFDRELTIKVTENVPLFYKKSGVVVLSNEEEIERSNDFYGLPTLVNYVPDKVYTEFIAAYKNIDGDIRKLINTIEYSPSTNASGTVIEEKRFILSMNDSNVIYAIPEYLKNLNYYLDILSSLNGKKGVINFETGRYDSFVFTEWGE